MVVYICAKLRENILKGIKVKSRHDFPRKYSKGHSSVKYRWSYAHCLMVVYICTKFHENILDGFKVKERTRFSWEKFQRVIIP